MRRPSSSLLPGALDPFDYSADFDLLNSKVHHRQPAKQTRRGVRHAVSWHTQPNQVLRASLHHSEFGKTRAVGRWRTVFPEVHSDDFMLGVFFRHLIDTAVVHDLSLPQDNQTAA